jgi:hypothetical protein
MRPSDVEKESARYRDTRRPLNNLADEDVDGIAQDLRADDGHGQLPSPSSALEPAHPSERECYREQKKQGTCRLPVWRKLMVGVWIQGPHAVEKGTAPHQTSSGHGRHHGPKEQKNTDGSHPTRWRVYRRSRGVVHSQTIIQVGLALN